MRRRTIIALAALVAAVAAVPVAGLAATGDVPAAANNSTDSGNQTDANATVAPGEQLAGVVDVQETELEGEVSERAYGIAIAQAATNQSKAEIVAERLQSVRDRLDELRQRKHTLRQARENGTISEGRYKAEIATLAARTQNAKRLANQSANVSEGLPADVLEANGINVSAIRTLAENASELTGPEVAEIARSIAGPNVGDPPGDRGPGELPERPGRQGGPDQRPDDGSRQTPDDGSRQDGTRTPDGQQSRDGQQTTDGSQQTPSDRRGD